jgi:CRP-like cAMP-binding protein
MRTPYETLKESVLFSGLSWEQCRGLVDRSSMIKMRDGDVVIHKGSVDDDNMWVILEGGVEVCVGDTTIAAYGEGTYIGELALLTGSDSPRSADVRATENTTLMQVRRDDLVSLVRDDPEAALAIMAELARRLRHTTSLLAGPAGGGEQGGGDVVDTLGPIEAGRDRS